MRDRRLANLTPVGIIQGDVDARISFANVA